MCRDAPKTACPPFSSGSQSSSLRRAPSVTTYWVFYPVFSYYYYYYYMLRGRKRAANAHLRVCSDLKPAAAQVALAPEREYRRRVIGPDLALLGVVADTHTNVRIA
jgi:hypothetical protein